MLSIALEKVGNIVDLTIVIPTYNEEKNVLVISEKIRTAMNEQNYDYEIIFVDDSRDHTPAVLEEISQIWPNVRYLHREGRKGLASAVVEGFAIARGDSIIVMDADLQHPPALIPLIVTRLSKADVVIPSRFIAGGWDGGLNPLRKLISWAARMIGQLSLSRLRHISDCTGGYFGINRSVIEGVALDPVGWKILIEILVKGRYEKVHEIPYHFEARDAGESKMNIQEQYNYLVHVFRLVRHSPEDRRFYSFCCIGALGVLVNLLVLKLLVTFMAFDELTSSLIATFAALAHNFWLNNSFTWKEYRQPVMWRRVLQFPRFAAISIIGGAITALFASFFVNVGWSIYLGQLTGIMVATFWNYSANNRWTWAKAEGETLCETKLVVTQEPG